HEQKVRQTLQEQGKQITNAEMEQYLMSKFRQAMSEEATRFYESDEDFTKVLNKLKMLFKAVTGQSQTELPEVPEHVTMDKVLTVMSETMEGINVVLETINEELQASGLDPESQEFKKQLQERYMGQVAKLRSEVQEKHGIGEELLHAAVLKYQKVESFQQQLMMLSNAHQQRLEKVGFKG
ncbi:Uncharacterized protein SCF082_LOCUS32975, partial [Durusdinium trenchii]